MQRSVRRIVLAAIAAVLGGAGCAAPSHPSAQAQNALTEATVATIAGSGQAGITDGPASSASFLLPVGIAVGKDGSVYVADQLAQRIRKLSNGVVTTIAGSGPLGPEKLGVAGGYRDGPALQAQFNWPTAIAIAPDGALYIADAGNHCIRKLDRGIVSTVVGKPGPIDPADGRPVPGVATDGSLAAARFADPRDLAFDARGNLYIADFGGGLRRLGLDRKLTTIVLKSTVEKTMMGLAIDTSDGDDTLAVSTQDQVIEYHPSTGKNEAFLETLAEGDRPFGTAVALVALNHREFLFADPVTATLRYLRFPARPYVNTVFTRTIAGGPFERQVDDAGYVDGTALAARFFDIAGIAVHDSLVYIADAGNRRIRTATLPKLTVSEAGPRDVTVPDRKHVDIAYIDSSITYWDSLGQDSICANLERLLDASGRLALPARCQTVRIDAAGLPTLHDYIVNYLAPQGFSTIVLQLSNTEVELIDMRKRIGDLMPAYKKTMEQIQAALKPSHTKLVVLWAYNAAELNGSEYFYARERYVNERRLPSWGYFYRKERYLPLQQTMHDLNIPQYDLFDDYLKYERGSSGTGAPLFSTTADGHPNPRGNAFIAGKLSDFLLSLPSGESGL